MISWLASDLSLANWSWQATGLSSSGNIWNFLTIGKTQTEICRLDPFWFWKLTSALEEICTLQFVRMSDISLSLTRTPRKRTIPLQQIIDKKNTSMFIYQVCQVFTWEKFCRKCFREISLPELGQDPTNQDDVLRYCESLIIKAAYMGFFTTENKTKFEKLHLNDLNNEWLHRGLRYAAKRNETLFRTRKQNRQKILLPLAISKDHIERYLASSPTTSKRSFPPPRRTRDAENLKGKCI